MFDLVVALVAGIAAGFLLRGRLRVNLSKIAFGVVLVLVFALGFSVGSNGGLLGALPSVGLDAAVIMLCAVGFSVLFVKLADRLVKLD